MIRKLVKALVFLGVLGLIGLAGFAYLGDLSPTTKDNSLTVMLDAD